MRRKTITLIIVFSMLLTLFTGCVEHGFSDEILDSIDMDEALVYTWSESIRLIEADYELRNEAERRYISNNWAFYSGYEIRPSVFMHPASTTEHTIIDYDADLTHVEDGALIFMEYGAGITDGLAADGVEFIMMINDTIYASDISSGGGWVDRYVDISEYAGEVIKVSFGTRGEPTTNYAWAAIGDPVINIINSPTNYMLTGEGREIESNVTGEINENSGVYECEGKVIIESPEFTNGDAYVILSGEGKPSLRAFTGNIRTRVTDLSTDDNSYRYLVVIKNRVIRTDDWDIALGLRPENLNIREFDFVPATARRLSLEFDSEEDYTIESVNVWRKPGVINIESFTNSSYREFDTSDTFINLTYSNKGSGAVLTSDGFGIRVEYSSEGQRGTTKLPGFRIPEMDIGSEYFKSINAGVLDAGEYEFSVYKIDQRGETLIDTTTVTVYSGDISPESDEDENIYLSHGDYDLVIFGTEGSYNEAYVYDNRTGRLAGSFALPRIVTTESDLAAKDYSLVSSDEGQVILSSETPYGEVLTTYAIEDGKVNVTNTLTASQSFGLRAFEGPHFLTGNQSFGPYHDSAIFAGIDYLSTEPSNNDLSTVMPYANRFVPDTRKVTAPIMTLANDGMVIIYSWDKDAQWIQDRNTPPARFEAPSLNGKGYGIMGIFAPSGTQYIRENETVAYTEFPVESGDVLTLSSSVEIILENEAIEGFVRYLQQVGLPEVPDINKEPLDVIRAMVRGLEAEQMGDRGWIGFIGVDTTPRVQTALLHTLILSKHLLEDDYRETAERILGSVNIPDPHLDWSFPDSIYWRMEKDYINSYLASSKGRMDAFLSSQSSDGTWSFSPGDKQDEMFGRAGDVTMGTVAVPALHLIKAARLTGDEQALEAAKQAVMAMSEFTKPAGAGPWELANSQPDILAVVLGGKAAMDLYDITGDEEVLEVAVRIAKQGLPFIYFREVPETLQSLYTAVPSFGSTNWHRPWQGSPVQWEAMHLSVVYNRLTEHDQTLDWGKIARGMANVGINLVNDDRWPGRFPDYLDLWNSDPTIYNIWSELVVASIYEDLGYINEWDQKRADNVNVIAGYEITEITVSQNQVLLTVNVPDTMPCYLVFDGRDISSVTVNGNQADQYDSVLDNVSYGFRKVTGEDSYILKVRGQEGPLEIIIDTQG